MRDIKLAFFISFIILVVFGGGSIAVTLNAGRKNTPAPTPAPTVIYLSPTPEITPTPTPNCLKTPKDPLCISPKPSK
ncbi:hypothetical protein A2773_06520 [Candidatus Gottesmanbacteria bacterium RIFCSPHIGHO2_01_FULL_39_10]|uniref:Uncharacterized protein n=1 Tax=Candidatus Gottesmanbacteria bacterium RIFCSPHIGHO2_01_FULL_39_10 TaxID=1798375 RepID=A0A1F5ZPH7_9BACT|nr:MAG: hypothetical protein A2773_06520 [Candidatus Gottesmanbacteria bacterium RIFCSPHIGHO2_01_FULL_39_10]